MAPNASKTSGKSTGRGPTMKDVARAAGVSSATVSYVMNNLGKVTPEVDRKVREAALRIGYARNSAATTLKTGRSKVLGCIVPTLLVPVFPEIMRAIHERARQRGYATFVVESQSGGEAAAAQALAHHGVDGAIAILEERPKILEAPLFPLVVLDRPIAGLDSVLCDHFRGGELMAEHALALGHRRVGLLSGSQMLESSRLRRDGFLHGLGGRAEVVWEAVVPLSMDLPQSALDHFRARSATFVACVNDSVAMGALNGLRALGISVPGDVSVMGFDNVAWAGWPVLDLSTIHQPLDEMGRRAVDLILKRIDDPDAEADSVVLPVRLQPRGSTGRAATELGD